MTKLEKASFFEIDRNCDAYTNKVMNTLQGYICNSRPRRFGKSITANMLTAYYSKGCSSKEMFSGLEISKAKDFEKHLNQYDVLHWDIQWCMEPAGGPERIVSYISEKTISELKEYYPNTLPEEIRSLPEAMFKGTEPTKYIQLAYLIHLGYLAYDQTFKTAFIPNEEIKKIHMEYVRKK